MNKIFIFKVKKFTKLLKLIELEKFKLFFKKQLHFTNTASIVIAINFITMEAITNILITLISFVKSIILIKVEGYLNSILKEN